MSTLHNAHNEWASRPADERFGDDRAGLLAAAEAVKSQCGTALIHSMRATSIEATGTGLNLCAEGASVPLSNYAFGQIAQLVSAPRTYLETLPGPLAAQCLNAGLPNIDPDLSRVAFMRDVPGSGLVVRGLESERYGRIWNADVARALFSGLSDDWTSPPAYNVVTPGDNGAWPITGNGMSPQGLYLGDRSMFIFQVNEKTKIDIGDGETLSRGFFCWNAEVSGARSFGLMTFFYDYVCGNHFVWGAQNVSKTIMRHVGSTVDARAMTAIASMLSEYATADATDEARKIAASKSTKIAETRDETIEIVRDITGLSKKATLASLALADAYADVHGSDGDHLWGAVSGITRYSQQSQWADDRVATDTAAAKLFVKLAA